LFFDSVFVYILIRAILFALKQVVYFDCGLVNLVDSTFAIDGLPAKDIVEWDAKYYSLTGHAVFNVLPRIPRIHTRKHRYCSFIQWS